MKEKLSFSYEQPHWWEILFSKYKGGRLTVGPSEHYHAHDGYDWEEILDDDLFSIFKLLIEPVANELEEEGNKVEYSWSFCHLFVRFVSREHAKDFEEYN